MPSSLGMHAHIISNIVEPTDPRFARNMAPQSTDPETMRLVSLSSFALGTGSFFLFPSPTLAMFDGGPEIEEFYPLIDFNRQQQSVIS